MNNRKPKLEKHDIRTQNQDSFIHKEKLLEFLLDLKEAQLLASSTNLFPGTIDSKR